jgi:hypothetical protein
MFTGSMLPLCPPIFPGNIWGKILQIPKALDVFTFRSTLLVRPGIVDIGSVPMPRWPTDLIR